MTTRGMREPEMDQIGAWIADVLSHIGDAPVEWRVRKEVAELARRFPVYERRVFGADGVPYQAQTQTANP